MSMIVFPGIDFENDFKTIPNSKSNTKSNIKSNVKSNVKSNTKSNIKTNIKTNTKSNAKSNTKSNAKSNIKLNAKTKIKSKKIVTTKRKTNDNESDNNSNSNSNSDSDNDTDNNSDSDSDTAIDIDDIDTLLDDDTSTNTNTKTNNVVDDLTPPVYNGEEEYYMFMRRWDAYTQRTADKQLHTNILKLINQLFKTDFKTLLEIKKLDEKTFPSSQKMVNAIESNEEYKKLFKIMYNKDIPTPKMLDSLLNKVKFSLVKVLGKKKDHYCVKSGICNRNDT